MKQTMRAATVRITVHGKQKRHLRHGKATAAETRRHNDLHKTARAKRTQAAPSHI